MPTIYKPKRAKKNEGDTADRIRRGIYDSARWRRLSRLKLAQDPLCELCKRRGVITPAEDVHHIVSFLTGRDRTERLALAYDYDNLMSLCKACHQTLHNRRASVSDTAHLV